MTYKQEAEEIRHLKSIGFPGWDDMAKALKAKIEAELHSETWSTSMSDMEEAIKKLDEVLR